MRRPAFWPGVQFTEKELHTKKNEYSEEGANVEQNFITQRTSSQLIIRFRNRCVKPCVTVGVSLNPGTFLSQLKFIVRQRHSWTDATQHSLINFPVMGGLRSWDVTEKACLFRLGVGYLVKTHIPRRFCMVALRHSFLPLSHSTINCSCSRSHIYTWLCVDGSGIGKEPAVARKP